MIFVLLFFKQAFATKYDENLRNYMIKGELLRILENPGAQDVFQSYLHRMEHSTDSTNDEDEYDERDSLNGIFKQDRINKYLDSINNFNPKTLQNQNPLPDLKPMQDQELLLRSFLGSNRNHIQRRPKRNINRQRRQKRAIQRRRRRR